jgi:prolyl-tRNA editing enzyme YbaK/EbsC (Cys-tRNA(Pro) deacylase)
MHNNDFEPWGAAHLATYIERAGISAEIIHLPQPTLTVADAAVAVGTAPEQIGKSILFLIKGDPLLVISNGLHRLRYKLLADHIGISRRRIKLAQADDVLRITGYAVGSVPPFGHKTQLPTIVETRVTALDQLYAGGGEFNALVRVTPLAIVQATQATVVTLTDASQ